jgi:uncharacterized damage-inducible protein DinB
MIPLGALKELFDFNCWARDRQLQTCSALRAPEFLRPLGSSFSSLRDTLAHLVGVEWLWLERWQGRAPRSLPAPDEFPNIAAISERWRAVERDMRQYLGGLTEEALAAPLTYVNLKGQEWTYPLWRMHMHLLMHQSFHRGQVTTMLRQLGAEPPAVDYLVAIDMGLGTPTA